ncbi:UDP-N-acetylglucosamine 3-dehydrogenase, partial [Armadillidium nasatum]
LFSSWEDVCNIEKFADIAIICTQDRDHVGPAVALAEKGYNILLEKPMSVTADDCKKIFKTCRKNDVMLGICYVLRYHPSVRKLKSLIEGDLIGEVVHVTGPKNQRAHSRYWQNVPMTLTLYIT